ncbi:redox-regulated ATPase YchF [candidate division WWE3 bacterium CG_4_9_14_0_2_um_filter_35_11]|uniref:Redox-regulated ATPase YchF n=1 Tax=candidate division WWE3 bacterium CG_4_9_14_0_2_um_filter_35_11 TaxID=1975077 RepID=A0A2M8EM68_UNCKA|nr:MAG: redox-regulated ATPase YchF [candidate division WWE3 bacterium CG10_big_fil_rev_8_21_14_0_10_35_32]PJC23834.1 MAG: redox-regulated ATPase YchF [candidate division WWE3 bacterium CG_4_9_14_0_2_um_filter_35_11]
MLKVGIVGLPNIGKSTLFNAILKREQALSANYPFATIDPNIGVVDVYDVRLEKLAEIVFKNTGIHPPKVYANIEFVDIAGLVEGASKGEGLGNQFLANIREVDMILQVVRDFSDTNIIREHSKDPETDSEVINSELIIKDLESIEKQLKIKSNDNEILQKYYDHLNSGKLAIELKPQIDKIKYEEIVKPLFLLTDKEMVYVFNVDETDERLKLQNNQTFKENPVIFINAKLESELSSLGPDDRKAYLSDLGIKEAGLDKIIETAFEKLGLITFLTAGEKEVRAWEIKIGTNAQNASGAIHTDFVKNFIKAEIVAYEDYITSGSKLKAKDAGKLRLEGKDYIVKDGDVIEFKIGA